MGYILLSMLDVLLGQMVLICYYYFFTLLFFFFGFIVSFYCFQCLKIQRKPHVKENETQTLDKKKMVTLSFFVNKTDFPFFIITRLFFRKKEN